MARSLKPLGRDFFHLQYAFATKVAEQSGKPLEQILFSHTCLFRRFGCARSDPDTHSIWQQYVRGLVAHRHDPVGYAHDFYLQAPAEKAPPRAFGCFNFDAPDADRVLRLHFHNAEAEGVSPLRADRAHARTQELAGMIAHIRSKHPDAKTVRGESWLSNLQAYRRLFPPSYSRSLHIQRGGTRFQGFSRWGQFLDRTGATRAGPAQQFLENLTKPGTADVAGAFPLPAYRAEASIEEFHDFFANTRGSALGQPTGVTSTATSMVWRLPPRSTPLIGLTSS